MTDDTAAALSAEDKARAEAQARREKILSKAENRLDMVAGVSARNEINDDGTNDANNNSSDAKKDAKAAKLAAMRRRRFKKGGGSATKKEGETTTTTSTKTVTSAEAAPSEAATKEETTAKVETTKEEVKETKPTETQEKTEAVSPVQTEAKSDDTKETTPTPSPTADAAEPSDPTATDAAPKKKYMGVAKMRRKMNKERQEREQQEQQTKEAEGATSATSSKKLRPKSKVKVLPILMHLAVTLLLFWAGLDIGLQQARIDYSSSSSDMESVVKVHATLAAPEQGQRLLNKVASWGGVQSSSSTKETLDQLVQDSAAYEVQDEEFQEADNGTPKGDNIDPLFQVDLDLYTQGPGLFMMAGRFAVAVHRVNLQIFYYLPLRLVGRVASVGQSLLNAPPMLCLVALAIRQAIGKLLLGAQLPDPAADSSSGGAQGKDLVSMVKNVAKNFFARAFPTLATLYDMWTHLRADMYVIFCGLFVGMAWHHFSSSPSLKAMLVFGGGDGSSSMTVPPAEPPTMATLESASSPVPVLPTDTDDIVATDERIVQMDGFLAEEEDEDSPEEEEEEEAAVTSDEDVNEDGTAGDDDEDDESVVSGDEAEADPAEDDDTNDDEERGDDEDDNAKETPPLSDEL